jgi:uncharacterized membrane protein YdjX (TVP38/TMEM64 family)
MPTDRPRKLVWIRALILLSMIAGGYVAIRYTSLGDWTSEERIRATLVDMRGIWWAPILLLVLYAVTAPFGISMFPLTIAGAAFGPVAGSVLNTIGIVLGAMTTFAAGRTLGRDFVVRFTGKRLRKIEQVVNRQGFWPLVQVRFLPVPYPLVNFAAALSAVPARRFVVASVIGLVPATLVHSYFIARLIFANGPERMQLGAMYAAVLVTVNVFIAVAWRRSSNSDGA